MDSNRMLVYDASARNAWPSRGGVTIMDGVQPTSGAVYSVITNKDEKERYNLASLNDWHDSSTFFTSNDNGISLAAATPVNDKMHHNERDTFTAIWNTHGEKKPSPQLTGPQTIANYMLPPELQQEHVDGVIDHHPDSREKAKQFRHYCSRLCMPDATMAKVVLTDEVRPDITDKFEHLSKSLDYTSMVFVIYDKNRMANRESVANAHSYLMAELREVSDVAIIPVIFSKEDYEEYAQNCNNCRLIPILFYPNLRNDSDSLEHITARFAMKFRERCFREKKQQRAIKSEKEKIYRREMEESKDEMCDDLDDEAIEPQCISATCPKTFEDVAGEFDMDLESLSSNDPDYTSVPTPRQMIGPASSNGNCSHVPRQMSGGGLEFPGAMSHGTGTNEDPRTSFKTTFNPIDVPVSTDADQIPDNTSRFEVASVNVVSMRSLPPPRSVIMPQKRDDKPIAPPGTFRGNDEGMEQRQTKEVEQEVMQEKLLETRKSPKGQEKPINTADQQGLVTHEERNIHDQMMKGHPSNDASCLTEGTGTAPLKYLADQQQATEPLHLNGHHEALLGAASKELEKIASEGKRKRSIKSRFKNLFTCASGKKTHNK